MAKISSNQSTAVLLLLLYYYYLLLTANIVAYCRAIYRHAQASKRSL